MSTTTPGHAPATLSEIHAAALAQATEAVGGLSAWDLARMAQCGTPGDGSEGADALDTARMVAAEAAEGHLTDADPAESAELCADPWDLVTELDDAIWEGVDLSGTLIYTARYREAFNDLDGWSEDVAADYGPQESVDQAAQLAVFSIMRRCAEAVAAHYAEAYAERLAELAEAAGLGVD